MAKDQEEAWRMLGVLLGVRQPKPDDPSEEEMQGIIRRTIQAWPKFGESTHMVLVVVSSFREGPSTGSFARRKDPDTLEKLDNRGAEERARTVLRRVLHPKK